MKNLSEIPGWVEANLGDFLQFMYGKSLPKRMRSGYGFPVYGANGVIDYHSRALTKGETLVIGRKGSAGEVSHSAKACFPIDTTYYVEQFYGMPSRYWFYLLSHLRLGELNKATAIPSLNRQDAYRVAIKVAPINEQKRIADRLDTLLAQVDACRARLDRVGLILKQFRQAVLAAATSGELTEDLRQDEEPWRKCKLGSLLADIRYGTSKKSSYELKNGSPVLRIPNIQDSRIDPSDMKYGYFNKKEIKNLVLKTGDLLIIRSNGSLALVGKVAIVEPEFEGYLFAGYLIRLRVDTSIIIPNYLSLYLSSPKIRKHIELTARSTNGINNINSKEIQAIIVEFPCLEEQYEIIRRAERLFAYADRLERHTQAAYTEVEHLTPALLDKAFRGELVPQNPNDEPASVLLERVRVEQAMQQGKPKRTRRPKRSKMSKNSVKKAIKLLPQDHFSFDELRDNVAGDYEKLKGIIFDLLNETEPSITQLFDEASQTMHFVRSNT